ncbi:MAG: 50S ribosomal protein L28 [Bdellovibrionaceae bacterium]|nr:50S ribosomal protein L28 [Pseudobdellovibrionaceae bacterium]
MAICELSGKKPVIKNLVSHSNIKTKKLVQPNVQYKRLFSKRLKKFFKLKLAVSTLRTIDHVGGFDTFVLNQNDQNLSKRALKIKQELVQSIAKKN